jgi:hypothetical protein
MALTDYKITDAQVAENGLVAAPDKLTGDPDENKALFDKLVREIVKEALNDIVDALTASGGAGEIGFDPTAGVNENNVQDAVENVQAQLAAYALGEIPDGSITAAKLAEDAVTLAKIAESVLHTDNFGYPSAVAVALGVDPSANTVSDVLSRLAEKFIITGAAAPSASTVGTVGQLYVDTAELVWYRCAAVDGETYTWELFERDRLGDFRFTYKNTLGDKYLLANGAYLTPLDGYDELYDYLTSTPVWQQSHVSSVLDTLYGCTKINGYFILSGKLSNKATIAYTTDPVSVPWTVVTVNSTNESYVTTKVIWDGTRYVAAGYTSVYNSGTEEYDRTAKIYYSTTLGGTWTSYTPSWNGASYINASSLKYFDGKVIACVTYSVFYTTDATNSTWSVGRSYAGQTIEWDGTNFFSTFNKVVYYGPTLALENSASIPLATEGYNSVKISYLNGMYLCPYYGASGRALYHSTNLSTWSSTTLSGSYSNSLLPKIFYDDDTGCYYRIDSASSSSVVLYYSTDPINGTWASRTISLPSSYGWGPDWDGLHKDSDGRYCFLSAYGAAAYLSYSTLFAGDAKALPSVTLSNTYAYIRAVT